MFIARRFRLASAFAALVVAFSMAAVDTADARARGSFGSRGTRTFQSAPPTNTVPNTVAPIQRSTTPAQQARPNANTQNPAAAQQRGGFLGGLGGSLFRGLMLGGLLGVLFGAGFGGIGGLFSLLFQVLLIGGAVWLVMRLVRGGARRPAMAGGPDNANRTGFENFGRNLGGLGGSGAGNATRPSRARPANPDELGVGQRDLDSFEQILGQVQTAYGAEDYETLRRLTTPEMMGYLAEQMAANATRGLHNRLADIKLLQGDIAESWREDGSEYATAALRYSLRDWTVERATDRVVEGDPAEPTEARELWTFVRQRGGDWKLSAIQEA
jgi:predicted lipid-binding transport protein (Tim44 family)